MKKVKDPICDMDVEVSTAKFKSEYEDKMYVFCSSYCKKTFDENPQKYSS